MTTLQDIKRIGEFDCNIAHLNAMTKQIKRQPNKVYEIIEKYGSFTDSFTRETIFNYIADKYYGGDYDKIYYQWLQIDQRYLKAYQLGLITKKEFNSLTN